MTTATGRFPDTPEISAAQAEDLVARIRAASSSGASEEVASLREALQPCIVSCNAWVAKLNGWLARGLLIEAASVNRSYPDLCRVAHALAMHRDRAAWDEACARAGVQPNDRIDEPAYRVLVDAVADASSIDEYVQRFQVAVLSRRPLAVRVRALQELRAAAPRNEAVRDLSRRYESEAIERLEESCREAAAAGHSTELFDALDAIEGLEWQAHFSAEFVEWLRTACRRELEARAGEAFRALATRVAAAFEVRDLELLLALGHEAGELARQHGTGPGEEFRLATGPALRWAEEERARLARHAEHAERCRAIRNALDQGYTYGELEQLRGRVLQLDLGIPDDVEARFGTAQAEWRASRRRRATMVVALSALAMAIALGGIGFLAHRLNWREGVLERTQRLGTLTAEGRFAEAERFAAEVARDDEEASLTPEFAAARARLAEASAAHDRRRTEVASILRDATTVAAGSDDAALLRASTVLRTALGERGMERALTPEERDQALAIAQGIDAALAGLRESREKAWADRLATLRRAVSELGDDDEQSLHERFSAEALADYRARLAAVERDLEAIISELPQQHQDLAGSRLLLERVRSSSAGAAAAAEAIAEAGNAVRSATNAKTEAELLDASRALTRSATVLKVRGQEASDLDLVATAAQAVQNWRETVLPALKAADSRDRVAIPATRNLCEPMLARLEDHVRTYPTSPYLRVARRWISLCRLVTSAKGIEGSDPVGVGVMKAIEGTGIMRLQQVELKGGQWAFVREDFPGGVGPLRGLVCKADDLTCAPGQLGDPTKWKALPANGRRDGTPWAAAYGAAKERLIAPDATLLGTQVTLLRMMADISDSGSTDPVALAGVMSILLPAFTGSLWDCQELAAAPCALSQRRARDYVVARDWPRLALALAGTPERVDLDSARKQVQAKLMEDAKAYRDFARDAESAWAEDLAESARADMVAVLLPSEAGTPSRRASAPIADGQYAVLWYDPALGRGELGKATFAAGVMQTGPSAAPGYAPIYRRSSQ